MKCVCDPCCYQLGSKLSVSAVEYFHLHDLVGNLLGHCKFFAADKLKVNDKTQSFNAFLNDTDSLTEPILVDDQEITIVFDNHANQLSSAKFSNIVKI